MQLIRHPSARWAPLGLLLLLSACGELGGLEEPTTERAQVPLPATRLRFRDVAAAAGIHTRNHCGRPDRKDYILESIGSGAAWLDYDNDGWLDVYVPDGDALANYELRYAKRCGSCEATPVLRRRRKPASTHHDQLWHNNGDGTFTDVAAQVGIREARWSFGVTAFDYDADGWTDLFVSNLGHDVLWHNNADGTFTDVAARLGVQGHPDTMSTCTAVGDVDGDGRLDLYVGAFADMAVEIDKTRTARKLGRDTPIEQIDGRFCKWSGITVFCGPIGLAGQHDRLYRQREDGTFEDVTERYGLVPEQARYAFTCLMFDFNGDGLLDIYTANDSVENFLWQQERAPDGTIRFRDRADIAGIKADPGGQAQASMGMALADVNRDGLLDITVTNFSHDHNNIYLAKCPQGRAGRRYYTDRGLTAVGGQVFYDLAWGVGWHDLDNDFDLDLFIANGHVYPDPKLTERTGASYGQWNALFECIDPSRCHFRSVGPKGQAEAESEAERAALEAGPGMREKECSRQAAFGDYDNDGRLDVFVTNINAGPSLLRNEAPDGARAQWVKLVLRQPGGNREALGAVIEITVDGVTQCIPVIRQTSFLGSDDPRLHVGLGAAKTCDVRVRWPDAGGKISLYANLEAGSLWLLDRKTGQARRQPLPQQSDRAVHLAKADAR